MSTLFQHIRKTSDGETVARHSTGCSWAITRWDRESDRILVIDELPYEGIHDMIAARAMADGYIDSYCKEN